MYLTVLFGFVCSNSVIAHTHRYAFCNWLLFFVNNAETKISLFLRNSVDINSSLLSFKFHVDQRSKIFRKKRSLNCAL